MAAVVKGAGIVWSHGALTFTAGITSSAAVANFLQTLTFERTSDNTKIKGPAGTVQAMVLSGFMKKLSLTVIPHGTLLADGVTSLDTHVSSAGAVNTLVGAKVTVADATGTTLVDGNWCCISAKQNKTVDGVATVDIELENSDEGVDLATSIA